MTPIAFYSTLSSVPWSDVIEEAFFCHMKEKKNIFPNSNIMQRVRDLGILTTKWNVSLKSLTFGFRESLGIVSREMIINRGSGSFV